MKVIVWPANVVFTPSLAHSYPAIAINVGKFGSHKYYMSQAEYCQSQRHNLNLARINDIADITNIICIQTLFNI
jgi:hypothetical protein